MQFYDLAAALNTQNAIQFKLIAPLQALTQYEMTSLQVQLDLT